MYIPSKEDLKKIQGCIVNYYNTTSSVCGGGPSRPIPINNSFSLNGYNCTCGCNCNAPIMDFHISERRIF